MNWKEIKERAQRATLKKILRKIVQAIVQISRIFVQIFRIIVCQWRRLSGIDWLKAGMAARDQKRSFDPKGFLISNSLIKAALRCQYLVNDFSETEPAGRGQPAEKVLFCSVYAGGYAEKFKSLLDSRINYCRKHGYVFALMKDVPAGFNRPYPWLRIPFIYRLMQDGFDRIFYLDADAMITNPEIKLEDFFARMVQPSPTSFFLCMDGNGQINTGSFFMRKNRGAQQLLDLIWQNVKFIDHYWWENASFMEIYRRFEEIRKITLLTREHRLFNSYDRFNDPWQEGDFILHFAGYRGDKLLEKIKFYSKAF